MLTHLLYPSNLCIKLKTKLCTSFYHIILVLQVEPGLARMLSVPAAVATLILLLVAVDVVVAVVVAVNMRYCLHGMHDNTLLRLPDKGRKVKARVSDRRDLPAAAASHCSQIGVLQLMQGSACCLLLALAGRFMSLPRPVAKSLARNCQCLHKVLSRLGLGY